MNKLYELLKLNKTMDNITKEQFHNIMKDDLFLKVAHNGERNGIFLFYVNEYPFVIFETYDSIKQNLLSLKTLRPLIIMDKVELENVKLYCESLRKSMAYDFEFLREGIDKDNIFISNLINDVKLFKTADFMDSINFIYYPIRRSEDEIIKIKKDLEESKIQRKKEEEQKQKEDLEKHKEQQRIEQDFVNGNICPICFGEGILEHKTVFIHRPFQDGKMLCYFCLGQKVSPIKKYLSFSNTEELKNYLKSIFRGVIRYSFYTMLIDKDSKWIIPYPLLMHPNINVLNFIEINKAYLLTFILMGIKEEREEGIEPKENDIALFLKLIQSTNLKKLFLIYAFPK